MTFSLRQKAVFVNVFVPNECFHLFYVLYATKTSSSWPTNASMTFHIVLRCESLSGFFKLTVVTRNSHRGTNNLGSKGILRNAGI